MAPVRRAPWNKGRDSWATHQDEPVDWRGWIALAWVTPFALLYTRMILERRAPGLLGAIRALGSRLFEP